MKIKTCKIKWGGHENTEDITNSAIPVTGCGGPWDCGTLGLPATTFSIQLAHRVVKLAATRAAHPLPPIPISVSRLH
jgi:hypothetical protein